MPKTIGKTKIEYLELLLENSEKGITPSEVTEVFFDDVTNEAAAHALHRLKKRGCAIRRRDGLEYRYWITDYGIMKYDYLLEREE